MVISEEKTALGSLSLGSWFQDVKFVIKDSEGKVEGKNLCCGSKFIEIGSGSGILAQFGSGSRVKLLILKKIIK